MGFVYFIIVLLATTIGAIAGVGGGVLIKPSLDALGHYDISTIGVLASVSVFSMAVVSTTRRLISGFEIDKKIILLGLGAVAGGLAGKEIFYLMDSAVDGTIIKIVQSLLIILLMILILFKNKIPRYCIENSIAVFFTGLILGLLAAFLGIGGGPVNVAVLYILLNMDIKKAAGGSILIILLAQAAKIISIAVGIGFSSYELGMLWYMIPAGITGGLAGSVIHSKISEKAIHRLFDITVWVVILLCTFNIVMAVI